MKQTKRAIDRIKDREIRRCLSRVYSERLKGFQCESDIPILKGVFAKMKWGIGYRRIEYVGDRY